MRLLSSIAISLTNPYEALLDALARTMAIRDGDMNQHGQRVRRYAMALAAAAGITDDSTIDALDAASLLHDIGKLGIPDTVLHKPGPLTADEYELVKRHVVIGADILSAVDSSGGLRLMVRHHHENWDGTGYPDRLRGEHIPIGARVLAIADCYDALTSDRPYRRALAPAPAAAMIAARRGTMYDPSIVDAFLSIVHSLQSEPACASAVVDGADSLSWLSQARAV